jgi:hypothetical protein
VVQVFEGVVRDNVVVLDDSVRLPEGVRVQVRVESPPTAAAADEERDPFDALLRRRAVYAGRRIDMDEIIEEEKQDREERFDAWLFPQS